MKVIPLLKIKNKFIVIDLRVGLHLEEKFFSKSLVLPNSNMVLSKFMCLKRHSKIIKSLIKIPTENRIIILIMLSASNYECLVLGFIMIRRISVAFSF